MFPGIPNHAFLVRFRPTGPWRFGSDSGARDRVELVYHSDAAFSAVTTAMARLGWLEEWLDSTARAAGLPVVKFSSFFPFQGDTLLVIPPRSHWPPPDSAKVRYKGARFVPVAVVNTLLEGGEVDENKWAVDGESQCLVPERNAQQGPFRIVLRSNAGVDRLEPGRVSEHSTACLEFARDAGLWTITVFASEAAQAQWEDRVRAAFRLLADSGFGGERSRGWGRSEMPSWHPLRKPAEQEPAVAVAPVLKTVTPEPEKAKVEAEPEPPLKLEAVEPANGTAPTSEEAAPPVVDIAAPTSEVERPAADEIAGLTSEVIGPPSEIAGLTNEVTAPTTEATAPSHVLPGLTRGASLCLPTARPT